MAILAIFHGPGITRAQYDTLVKDVGWKKHHPPGAMIHVASFDAKGGLHVADVWESQAMLDAFVSTQLMPAMQRHGMPAPQVEVFEVHNIDVFRAVESYFLR